MSVGLNETPVRAASPVANGSPGVRATRALRQWITTGQLPAGERLAGENALASRLGVARTTVRSAIAQLQNEGLIRCEGRARYVVDPRTARGTISETVLVLTPRPSAVASASPMSGYNLSIVSGAVDAIRKAGLHSLVLHSDSLDEKAILRLANERPPGMIAFRHTDTAPAGRQLVASIKRAGVKVVVYGQEPETESFDTVTSDHCAGEYAVTRWLIESGCRRILRCWSSTTRPGRSGWISQRDRGYEQAMSEAGLPILAPIDFEESFAGEAPSSHFQAAARLMAGHLVGHLSGPNAVDALITLSDGHAFIAAAACRLHGREPGRSIKIAGYDNVFAVSPEREWEPSLPVVTVDKKNLDIGRQLVDLLLRKERTVTERPEHRVVAPELVVI